MSLNFQTISLRTEYVKLTKLDPLRAKVVAQLCNHPKFSNYSNIEIDMYLHQSYRPSLYSSTNPSEWVDVTFRIKDPKEYRNTIKVEILVKEDLISLKHKSLAQFKWRIVEFNKDELNDSVIDKLCSGIDEEIRRLNKRSHTKKVRHTADKIKLIGTVGRLNELVDQEKMDEFERKEYGTSICIETKRARGLHSHLPLDMTINKNKASETYQIKFGGALTLNENDMLELVSKMLMAFPLSVLKGENKST